jgi:MFS family permease
MTLSDQRSRAPERPASTGERSLRLNAGKGPAAASLNAALARIVLIALMLAAAAVAFFPFILMPAVVPATAPAEVFSAERAMQDLRAVASQPRSMGTAAHTDTIATIRQRLSAMGVESQIVEDVVAAPDFNQVFAARVRNVMARIPGTGSGGAVMLFSHFDSVPTSMNANDGGLGVATVLEAARAIKAGPPLSNDVVLWFADADETTAMASHVLERQPWFDDVRLGMAFEGTGVRGPSILTFAAQSNPEAGDSSLAIGENEGVSLSRPQLSAANGRWLREALAVVPHPVVGLQLNDIAMGASPDLAIAMMTADRMASVSFAQVGDTSGYHTDLDNPDRVGLPNLQDSGAAALALTRHFGEFDFDAAAPMPGLVAFNVLPGLVATYPFPWALPLALIVAAALVGMLVVGKRRRALAFWAVGVGIVLTLISVAVAALLAMAVSSLLDPGVHVARSPYGSGWRMLLLGGISLATIAGVFVGAGRLLRTPPRILALGAGPLVVLSALAVGTAAATPSLSYVFVWPTLAGVALLGWRVLRPDAAEEPWGITTAFAAVGAVVALTAVPLVYLVASAAPIAAFAPFIAAITALLGSALVPHFQHLTGRRAWVVPLVLIAAIGSFAVGERTVGRFDADTPRPNYIQYTLDADAGTASWLSTGTRPDLWTEQFFAGGFATGRSAFSPGYYFGQEYDVITAPAPPLELAAPQVVVVSDSVADEVRTLRLRLRSPRGGAMVHLDLALPGDLVAAAVEGETVEVDESMALRRFPIAAYNTGTSGVEVSLSVRSTDTITGTLADFTNGLPDIPGFGVNQRPTMYMPAPLDFRDPTVVQTAVEL